MALPNTGRLAQRRTLGFDAAPVKISKKQDATSLHSLTLFDKATVSNIAKKRLHQRRVSVFIVVVTHDCANGICCFVRVIERD